METIFFNGKIITMENEPYTDCVLVKNGIIKDTGSFEKISALYPSAQKRDLEGRALMPSFIDPHSHFMSAAITLLYPSVSRCKTFDDIQRLIKEFVSLKNLDSEKWLVLRDFDQSVIKENAYPNKKILDEAAPEIPVVLQHKSGHSGVFSSKALQILGIDADTKSAEGGTIEIINGEPTGYMDENAYIKYIQKIPLPDSQSLQEAIKKTQNMYFSKGITTIQEGMLVKSMVPIYEKAMELKLFKADIVGFVGPNDIDSVKNVFSGHIKEYKNNFKIGGIKIFLDGSPQNKTAYMSRPYIDNKKNFGSLTMKNEEVLEALKKAVENDMQILCHCNGDKACDIFINCVNDISKIEPRICSLNPVIIHAQFINPAVLPFAASLGITASFFVAHILHWGELHIKNLGYNRASQMSPLNSALQCMPFTLHQDTPVINPDMFETIYCAVSRKTSAGRVIGQNQKISVYNALKAVTMNAAKQYSEQNSKGSISKGKRADLIILDKNPLEVSEDEIRNVNVIETIKDGETVWKAEEQFL